MCKLKQCVVVAEKAFDYSKTIPMCKLKRDLAQEVVEVNYSKTIPMCKLKPNNCSNPRK